MNFAGAAYAPQVVGNSAVSSRSRRDSGSGASTCGQSWESTGTGSSNSGCRCAGSKRHSETSMRNIMNRPEYFESYASLKKNILGSKSVNAMPNRVGGSAASWSLTKRISKNSSDPSPMVKNTPSADSTGTSSSGYSSVNSLGSSSLCDSSSQSSHHIREWEEELARIEARSKESSALIAFVKQRRKSTLKSPPARNS